ncbi:MAG TPA: ribonuclease HI family protein [Bacteroidota bacterium]|nr:ribonuclease HI family protein [Bacteroidota bacterium]
MRVLAYTDGASRGNPGDSGIGVILKDEKGNTLATHFDFIGTTTNNVAEYKALVHCLKMARETKCTHLIVHSDSELMVRQLQGVYKVKDKELRRFFDEARQMLASAPFEFEIRHVAREENRQADELANKGINLKT